MRKLIQIVAGAALVVSATALAAGTALADPPTGVKPRESDVVGVGSDTTEFLYDQLSFDYNKSHTTGPRLYSWDALNPVTGLTDNIVTKSGCAAIARPDGASAGIAALVLNAKTADGKHFCIDYARSARARASTDPPKASGGVVFVALGTDAAAWATNATTNAPSNLSTAQLTAIYTCTDTTWNQVGGTSTATIQPFLPQTGSGLRSSFLKAIGVPTPGSCVNSSVQQNQGIDPQFTNNPNAMVPYSVAKYISQVFHSAKCTNSTCTGNPPCVPNGAQNKFGCDEHGLFVLHDIDGTAATTGTGGKTTINAKFSPAFLFPISEVVRFASTADNIPSYTERFWASATAKTKGWACTSSTAKTDLLHYGFLPTPFCGTGS